MGATSGDAGSPAHPPAERPAAPRRGRPPGTSARALEEIALELFAERGFEAATIDQIASAAGVSKRTFFRYFDSKADVLWSSFDLEVEHIRHELAALPDSVPVMDAVRRAVLAVNHYGPEDVPELRARMVLISSVPELGASAAMHYDAWEQAVTDYVARRMRCSPEALFPRTIGRVTLAACRAAYEHWAQHADAELTVYLDAALRGLAAGFDDRFLAAPGATDEQSMSASARD